MIRTIDGKSVLDIFENFQTDRNLPKFTNTSDALGWTSNGDNSSAVNSVLYVNDSSTPMWSISAQSVANMISDGVEQRRRPVSERFSSWLSRTKSWIDEKRRVSPEKVFAQIIGGNERLEMDLASRLNAIDTLKAQAKENGQTALGEQIVRDERRLRSEAVLATAGFRMFLSETMMVEFARKCERGLRLDWIKNFTRLIPAEVIEQKRRADQLKVFDNYVILHFDPQGKATSLTEEEVRKKKDPILFGVFSQSRRLYFIGDWKDEYCDLTLEEVLKTLGEKNPVDSSKIVLP